MLFKYVAAVVGFAKSVSKIEVPLVALEELEYHHPLVSSNVTLVKLVQEENALLPMLVTLVGIVMLVKLEHTSNA